MAAEVDPDTWDCVYCPDSDEPGLEAYLARLHRQLDQLPARQRREAEVLKARQAHERTELEREIARAKQEIDDGATKSSNG